MLTVLLVVFGTLLYGTLVGHLTHWTIHQEWSGNFHRAHMNHHIQQYPPKDLLSNSYLSAGRDDGLWVFIPAVSLTMGIWALVLWFLGVPSWVFLMVGLEGVAIGWLHNYIHEGTHLRYFWLEKSPWFQKLRTLHWVHHWNMRRNFGICWFGWDHVFGTYKAPK